MLKNSVDANCCPLFEQLSLNDQIPSRKDFIFETEEQNNEPIEMNDCIRLVQ